MDAAGLGALREGEEGEGMDETPTAGIRKVMSRTASSGMSAKRERDSDREIDATTGSESVASGHEQGAEAEAFPPAPSGQPKQEAMMLQYLKEAEERLVQRLALLDETLLQVRLDCPSFWYTPFY